MSKEGLNFVMYNTLFSNSHLDECLFLLQAKGELPSVLPSHDDDSDPGDLSYFEPTDSGDSDIEPDSSVNKEMSLTAGIVQVCLMKVK